MYVHMYVHPYACVCVIEITFLLVIRRLFIKTELEITEHHMVAIALANAEGRSVMDKNQN